MNNDGECRVRVILDGLQLDYRAHHGAAERFATAMRTTGVAVTIYAGTTEGLRPLPCAQLWSVPDVRTAARRH